MHTQNRTWSMLPVLDFSTDRAAAPLLGFVVAAALSAALWVALGWALSGLLQ